MIERELEKRIKKLESQNEGLSHGEVIMIGVIVLSILKAFGVV